MRLVDYLDKGASLRIGSSTAWVSETPGATAGFLEFTGQGLTTFERAMDRASCGDPDIEDKAAKIFLAADAVNLKRQQLEQKKLDAEHARKLKLIEAAIRLGIVSDGRAAIGGTVISAPEC